MGWIVIAVAFAGVWVYAIVREDYRNPEPLWLVGLAIVCGMIAVPVASRIEEILTRNADAMAGPLISRAWLAFMVAGPVEEVAKFLAVALLVWFQSNFDEPMDGIVYASAAAAGFALAENLRYMQDQPASILARGPAATGAHILFAGFWGGALGHAKRMKSFPAGVAITGGGLGLGIVSHGLFDLTTWSVDKELTLNQARLIQVSLIICCAAFLRWRIRAALRIVPSAQENAEATG